MERQGQLPGGNRVSTRRVGYRDVVCSGGTDPWRHLRFRARHREIVRWCLGQYEPHVGLNFKAGIACPAVVGLQLRSAK